MLQLPPPISSVFSIKPLPLPFFIFFFFNDTATTEIYTLSLHDALPICLERAARHRGPRPRALRQGLFGSDRSEEHTSELQSHLNLVCRLLLEKKKKDCASVHYLYAHDDIHPCVTQRIKLHADSIHLLQL